MLSPIPPLMMLFPATLPFGKQLSPPILSRAAVFAVVVDRLVQSEFGFFDGVAASVSLVCMYSRSCSKQQQSSRQNRPRCRSYESSVQSNLLSCLVNCAPESSQMLRKVGLPFDTVHTVSLIVCRQQSIVEFLAQISGDFGRGGNREAIRVAELQSRFCRIWHRDQIEASFHHYKSDFPRK
jgi:hypothetical protein